MNGTVSRARGARDGRWTAAALLSALAIAWWLRAPGVIPAGLGVLAAGVAALLAAGVSSARTRVGVATVALGVAAAAMLAAERTRVVTRANPTAVRAARDTAALALLDDAMRLWERRLVFASRTALDAPTSTRDAFRALDLMPDEAPEAGVVLFRDGRPIAWRGTIRVPLVGARDSVGTIVTPFYVAVYAAAQRGNDRAIATMLVHAETPANRFARALDEQVAQRAGIRGFVVGAPAEAPGAPVFSLRGVPVLAAVPIALSEGALELRTAEGSRRVVGVFLALAILAVLIAGWHPGVPLSRRLLALAAAVGAVVVAPLSTYSNVTRWFDPAVYYVRLGGPFTASLAAFVVTGAAVLVAMYSMRHAALRFRSRWAAIAGVLVLAGAGPYLLRDLARGIVVPETGSTMSLWIGWQLAVFFAALALLLLAGFAGRRAIGRVSGVPVWAAPACALIAAMIAPVFWRAPAGWPDPYVVLWIAAVALLALARTSRLSLLAASLVAASGSMTLVWGATARARVGLATADVSSLRATDPDAAALLARLASSLEADPPLPSREALLTRYAEADLVAAGYPLHLAQWQPAAQDPIASVTVAPFADPEDALVALVDEARATGRSVAILADTPPFYALAAAVPHADGRVTTAVVGPRTRLLADESWASLLGLTRGAGAEPPFEVLLADGSGGVPGESAKWTRRGNELFGDWVIAGRDIPLRVHATVDLRSLDAAWQRGVLLLLLDVAVALGLWLLHALAHGAVVRWWRLRVRRVRRSYRARLTLALFGFSLVPVIAFAVWSLRRLGVEERRIRELVVQELLRNALAPGFDATLETRAQRADAPLLVYRDGELFAASEPFFSALAPTGRYLPPAVQLDLEADAALTATAMQRVGMSRAVVGYRGVSPLPADGGLTVVGSPARADDAGRDRQREDLAVLLVVAAVVAALGAWWLSGVAAKVLSAPIGQLREAIDQVAQGARVALPPTAAPAEFASVFSAFTRMADDLAESRSALEDAQRRTAAVLRQVASGVVAVNPEGAVTLANPAAEELLGMPLPAGTPLSMFASRPLAEKLRRYLAAPTESAPFEMAVGNREWRVSLAALRRGGAVITFDDVTDLARAQRVLAWGEMARQVAHEIKNPLTPIRLGVQHLQRAHADGRPEFPRILSENVGRILEEIDRLDEIARTFSRYGTPVSTKVPSEAVDAAAITRDVISLEVLGASEVQWRAEGCERPAWVRAADAELREVLLNLLENARHAGAKHVVARLERNGRDVLLRVRDDGSGITEDVLARVFEPHFSTTTSGSGLGLAISRRMVEGWGGRITIESAPGAGTTVTIALAEAMPVGEISV
jgi:signal transduction histidine kinase